MRIIARFVPQAWINDNAVEVDAEGDTEWDATSAFEELDESYRADLREAMTHFGEGLDEYDRLKSDPNAPEWVREWSGPFSLYVREDNGDSDTVDEDMVSFSEQVQRIAVQQGWSDEGVNSLAMTYLAEHADEDARYGFIQMLLDVQRIENGDD